MWCLIALSVALLVIDHRSQALASVHRYLSFVVYPIQLMVDLPTHFFIKLGSYISSQRQLVKENTDLQEQQFLQQGRLQQLQALEAENARLRVLLQATPRGEQTLTAAEILQIAADPFNHFFLIDKGEKDVYVGQPIIDAEGVIGEIVEVFPFKSRAILVTDPSHAIPVENLRNGVRGIVVGTGKIDSFALRHVPNTADIKEGDTLVTSGIGGRYPAGYPVGVVKKIERDVGESFAEVKVVPAAHLERGRQILLIAPKKKAEENGIQE